MKKVLIESKTNEKIKLLKRLSYKKYRDKFSRFTVENATIIYDALKSGFDFESLFVTEDFIKNNKLKFQFFEKQSKTGTYFVIDHKLNKFFSQLESAPGICAVYEKLKPRFTYDSKIVYLNAINDPGNVGAILRSALAFNIKNVVIDEKCADLYNVKTINASKDSIFKLNIAFDKDLKLLKQIGQKMPIVSSSVKKGQDLSKLKTVSKFCLVLGSESHGVDDKILKLSDDFLKIKISGEIESLNVAAAAAIIFHEMAR